MLIDSFVILVFWCMCLLTTVFVKVKRILSLVKSFLFPSSSSSSSTHAQRGFSDMENPPSGTTLSTLRRDGTVVTTVVRRNPGDLPDSVLVARREEKLRQLKLEINELSLMLGIGEVYQEQQLMLHPELSNLSNSDQEEPSDDDDETGIHCGSGCAFEEGILRNPSCLEGENENENAYPDPGPRPRPRPLPLPLPLPLCPPLLPHNHNNNDYDNEIQSCSLERESSSPSPHPVRHSRSASLPSLREGESDVPPETNNASIMLVQTFTLTSEREPPHRQEFRRTRRHLREIRSELELLNRQLQYLSNSARHSPAYRIAQSNYGRVEVDLEGLFFDQPFDEIPGGALTEGRGIRLPLPTYDELLISGTIPEDIPPPSYAEWLELEGSEEFHPLMVPCPFQKI